MTHPTICIAATLPRNPIVPEDKRTFVSILVGTGAGPTGDRRAWQSLHPRGVGQERAQRWAARAIPSQPALVRVKLATLAAW